MQYTQEDIDYIMQQIRDWYAIEHPKLVVFAENAKNGGQIRAASGKFVECFLQNIINQINDRFNIRIESKVGSTDYLSKRVPYQGKILILPHIQVDRHVVIGDKRIAFIENKTYLDSCYWDRALADFRKIVQALYQQNIDPGDMEYIVFSGQDSLDPKTCLAYEGDFYNDTKALTKHPDGIVPKICYFLQGKRQSNKPMYKIRYQLNEPDIIAFIKLILSVV